MLLTMAGSLSFLYLGRFLNGAFASSIALAAYARVGDRAPTKEWRVHRFALLNIAGAGGFLVAGHLRKRPALARNSRRTGFPIPPCVDFFAK
jgi:MFS family permease